MNAAAKVVLVRLSDIRPCPENNDVYGGLSLSDPDLADLLASIHANGLLEPIRISADSYVISGHRRRFCARLAGLEMVPVIRDPISYAGDHEAFLRLLVEANSQRKKTPAMLLKEAVMKIDPEQAVDELRQEQQSAADERRFGDSEWVGAKNVRGRRKISAASMPFLEAALRVIEDHQAFWPLSVRQIHYRLLGPDAPLKHAAKPDSTYSNDAKSYRTLCDLLARGRVEGRVPWQAIDDETRPEMVNNHFWNAGQFFQGEISNFLRGYTRNRQQSQPNHIEIIAEKLTVKTILESVAERYSIPLTINRGMSGPTVKKKVVDRFWLSGKERLILLVVSDLDPAGDAIAQDIRDAFERDFDIDGDDIETYKVALTIDQVESLALEPSMEAKESSPTYSAFVERYGITDAYELEALEPADLQQILVDAIERAMDMRAYEAELERETQDAVTVKATKSLVVEFLKQQGLT